MKKLKGIIFDMGGPLGTKNHSNSTVYGEDEKAVWRAVRHNLRLNRRNSFYAIEEKDDKERK